MKNIKMILKVVLRLVRFAVVGVINWCIVWPLRIGAIGLFAYPLISYILFQSFEVDVIRERLIEWNLNPELWMPVVGLPLFLSFISCNGSSDTVSRAIEYRDGVIRKSSYIKGSEIYEKTSLLDVLESNKDNQIYERAKLGMNARYGNSTSSKIIEDMLK